MSEDDLNLDIRRFLKQFGVAAQRALEDAGRAGKPGTSLRVKATLEVDGRTAHVQQEEIVLPG